ncbi:MAG: sigma-70 family RNA polymerase sigma factor [Planctomycetes bacterium]|nr:sigma-70 family RNA polymerase sigma factor [Planctomycetota bacterium]
MATTTSKRTQRKADAKAKRRHAQSKTTRPAVHVPKWNPSLVDKRGRLLVRRRNRMVEENLGLAGVWAGKVARRSGLDFEDLNQEAIITLTRAAELFDPGRGYQFSTYASTAIIRRLRAIERRHFEGVCGKEFELQIERGAAATESVSAIALNLPEIDLSILPERTRYVIVQRFGLGGVKARTLEDVGRTLDLNKERVRQIQNDGLAALRNSRPLREYCEQNRLRESA